MSIVASPLAGSDDTRAATIAARVQAAAEIVKGAGRRYPQARRGNAAELLAIDLTDADRLAWAGGVTVEWWVDEYLGRDGPGFEVWVEVSKGGAVARRCWHFGPEKWRDAGQAWRSR